MLTALLISCLAASPLEGKTVVVVSNSDELAAQALKSLAARGAKVIDASDVYNAMLGADGARFRVLPDSGHFEPADGIDKAARADFERGLRTCRRQRRSSARWDGCLNQLVNAVWQRQLKRLHADWVYRFRRVDRRGDTAFAADVSVHAVDSKRQLIFGAGSAGPHASLSKEVESALDHALQDGKPNRAREVFERLP